MAEAAEHRLRRLEDREAIRELIARYGPLADAGEAQALAALWSEDGEYDVGGFGIARGRPAIAALIDADFHRSLMAQGCAHVLSPPTIDLDGDRAMLTVEAPGGAQSLLVVELPSGRVIGRYFLEPQ